MALIKPSDITTDKELKPRALITSSVVYEYAEAMRNGEIFPPVIIFNDGKTNWLADGYHRYYAAEQAGIESLSAEIRTGTRQDALKYALGANTTHGLRRSNVDKRRSILIALRLLGGRSNREIGRIVKVDDKTVAKYRERMLVVDEIKERIATGENFNAKHGEAQLLIVKLEGPFTKVGYLYRDKGQETFNSITHGVCLQGLETAVCVLTHGLVMVDFESWSTLPTNDALELFELRKGMFGDKHDRMR